MFDKTILASVPLSIRSIFVMTPRVLSPFSSHFFAKARACDVGKSILAGTTAKIMVLSSYLQYFATSSVVTFSMSTFSWSDFNIATLVIPGRSISVKSGHSGEKTKID